VRLCNVRLICLIVALSFQWNSFLYEDRQKQLNDESKSCGTDLIQNLVCSFLFVCTVKENKIWLIYFPFYGSHIFFYIRLYLYFDHIYYLVKFVWPLSRIKTDYYPWAPDANFIFPDDICVILFILDPELAVIEWCS
jgi:hypothetical protein